MKAFTIRDPWATAIAAGWKDVENRSRNIVGSYRGPVAIHLSTTTYNRRDANWAREFVTEAVGVPLMEKDASVRGSIIAIAEIVSVHHDRQHGPAVTCSEWAFDNTWHIRLGNIQRVEPVRVRGQLGLWNVPDEIADSLRAIEVPF